MTERMIRTQACSLKEHTRMQNLAISKGLGEACKASPGKRKEYAELAGMGYALIKSITF